MIGRACGVVHEGGLLGCSSVMFVASISEGSTVVKTSRY